MTKNFNLKKLGILIVLLMGTYLSSMAQNFQVLTQNGFITSGASTPQGMQRWCRNVFLISQAEMAAAGIPNGQVLNYLRFNLQAAAVIPVTGNIGLFCENTANTTYTKGTTWATAVQGMTQVTNASVTIPTVAGQYAVNFNTTPFTYTGGGLYIAMDYSNVAGTLSTTATNHWVTTLVTGMAARASTTTTTAPATLLTTAARPDLALGFAFNNDAAVVGLYTLGKMPIEYGAPTTMQASIRNLGVNTLTNIPVTLNVSGTNSFTDVQTVASLAPGATTVVNFAPYSPASLSTNDVVTATVPADDVNTNNSSTWNMNITPNIYTYKNPALPNNGGVGFNTVTGDFVAKFNSNIGINFPYNLSNPIINEIKVDFTTSGQPYRLGVWLADGVGGAPGTLLWESPGLTTAVGTAVISVPTSPTPVVVTGDYYVGVRQLGTVNVGFAYQTENPIRPQTFYFTTPTGSTSWTDFNSTGSPFRFSIEVSVEIPVAPNCPLNLFPADAANLPCQTPTLSWGNGGGGTTSYDVYFSTIQADVNSLAPAALVSANQAGTTYLPTTLPNTTYYWNVIGKNTFGDATGCVSQSFTTGVLSNCYCVPFHGTQCNGEINNVTLNTLANTSACSAPGYILYPASGATTTTLEQGSTYALSVTCDTASIISVWIDYDQNGIFDVTEWNQVTLASTANIATTYNLTIPASALLGQTLMRIRSRFTGNPNGATDACIAMGSGESEDYVVTILPQPPCAGTPNPGNTIASVSSYCPNLNGNVTLSLQNGNFGSGISFQWEVADDLAFTTNLTPLGTASTEAYVMTGGDKYFRCTLTCSNSSSSATSTPVLVTQNPFSSCYCTSVAGFVDDEEITNVTIGTGSTNPAHAGANACTAPAPGAGSLLNQYSNFTSLVPIATVSQGVAIPFSVEQDECDGAPYFAAGVGMWIDLNHDGDFTDLGEDVFIEPTTVISPRTLSGTITIPTSSMTGVTRVRIICAEGFSGATLQPCMTYGYGETEDYLIDIQPPSSSTLNLTCFLQGFYIGGNTMNSTLANQGLANPLTDCDDVIVELHDATSPYAMAYSHSGILQTNGTISCTYPVAAIGNPYYIVVKHRNSVETWSGAPVTMAASTSYNFSTAATQAFGGNQFEVETGVWGFYTGDINQDYAVDGLDFILLDPDLILGTSGYLTTDLNGDGTVDALDYVVFDPNLILGVTIVTP